MKEKTKRRIRRLGALILTLSMSIAIIPKLKGNSTVRADYSKYTFDVRNKLALSDQDISIISLLKQDDLIGYSSNSTPAFLNLDKDENNYFDLYYYSSDKYYLEQFADGKMKGTFIIDTSFDTNIAYDYVEFIFSDDATTVLNELRFESTTTTVTAGVLPSYTVTSTTPFVTASPSGSRWSQWLEGYSSWHGFGDGVPTAYNDGSTHYALCIQTELNTGYSINENTRLIFNGIDYTEVGYTSINRFAWGGYVNIDLGLAGTDPIVHTVTFDSQGGSSISSQQVPDGVAANVPTSPEKPGFLFKGWFQEASCENAYNFSTPITADTTIYAKWVDANVISAIYLESTTTMVQPGVLPSFEVTTTTEHATVSVYGNNTYWVHWPEGYSSWHAFGGETPTAVKDGKTIYGMCLRITLDTDYQILDSTRIIFNGVDITGNGKTMVDSFLSWGGYIYIDLGIARDPCTVTFDANGGTTGANWVNTQVVGEGLSITLPEVNASLVSAPQHMAFAGYDINGTTYAPGDEYVVNSDVTVKCLWEISEYVVTFDANGGEPGANWVASTEVGKDMSYTLPEVNADLVTAPLHMAFAGYEINGTKYAPGDAYVVSSDVIVKFLWEVSEYVVTFEANGGTKGAAWIDSQAFEKNWTWYIPNPDTSIVSPPAGAMFYGVEIEGVMYSAGDAYTIDHDITVRFCWIPAATLTFDANGGIKGAAWTDTVQVPLGLLMTLDPMDENRVKAPAGMVLDAYEIDGVRYEIGSQYLFSQDTSIKLLWKAAPTPAPDPVTPAPQPVKDPSFEEFIDRLYLYALLREPEADGKAFWMNKVLNEGFTGGRCAYGFLVEAQEFLNRDLTNEQFIDTLYQIFFDRAPDEGGKAFWLEQFSKGMTRAEMVNGFIDSTEWCNLCASYGVKSGAPNAKAEKPSNNAIKFATRLYTECLGREYDADGLQFWALRLTNLESSGYEAALGFFTSEEFTQKGIGDDEFIHRLYRTFMGRDEDADGFAFWKSHLGVDMTREDLIKGFAQSQEFTNICNQYGIDKGI